MPINPGRFAAKILPTAAGNDRHAVTHLAWPGVEELISQLADAIRNDSVPQTLVAILRGGAIPAVCLSHRLALRDVRMVEVTHTADDSTNAAKTAQPQVVNPASLGDLIGRDILIVDDVAGTGDTLAAAGSLGSEQRSRYLPSRFASVLTFAASMRSSPFGVVRRYRFRPGLVEMTPRSSARLVAV